MIIKLKDKSGDNPMVSNSQMEEILSYRGPLKYDTIGELINDLKRKVPGLKLKLVVYKKLLLIMIESLENILKYNENFDPNSFIRTNYSQEFKIERNNEKYFLRSTNVVLNKDIPRLKEKINQVNSLDNNGLKKLYKSTITNGRFSRKGGAGLGFIEMAKISTEKIQFNFKMINKEFSYYKLTVVINEDFYRSNK
jgi:hypothetical protein